MNPTHVKNVMKESTPIVLHFFPAVHLVGLIASSSGSQSTKKGSACCSEMTSSLSGGLSATTERDELTLAERMGSPGSRKSPDRLVSAMIEVVHAKGRDTRNEREGSQGQARHFERETFESLIYRSAKDNRFVRAYYGRSDQAPGDPKRHHCME